MSGQLEREKAEFSEEELAQHALVREMLWIFYPQDNKDMSSRPSEDGVADQAATAIIAALKYKRHAVLN